MSKLIRIRPRLKSRVSEFRFILFMSYQNITSIHIYNTYIYNKRDENFPGFENRTPFVLSRDVLVIKFVLVIYDRRSGVKVDVVLLLLLFAATTIPMKNNKNKKKNKNNFHPPWIWYIRVKWVEFPLYKNSLIVENVVVVVVIVEEVDFSNREKV